MENSIHNLETKIFTNDTGEFPAVVMGLNIHDRESIESFIDHVMQQLQNQRMCSPRETSAMTITVAGYLPASEFVSLWRSRIDNFPVLKHFMSTMKLADVMHISRGELLDDASLIE